MTNNRWRWRWGRSMARALMLSATFAGQWLGICGKEAQAQERLVPAGDSAAAAEANLVTNVYQLSPHVLSHSVDGIGFHSPVELLTHAGVAFPNGAMAVFNAGNDQLVVRNTQDQLDLVEAFIDSLQEDDIAVQIHVTAAFASSSERLLSDELGIAPPKISSVESAAFLADDQGAVVGLLKETNLEHAVARAENRTIRQAVTMNAEAAPTVLTAMAYSDLLDHLRERTAAQDDSVKLVEGTGALLGSAGPSLLIQAGDRGVGISSAIVGADYQTLDLAIYSQGPPIEGRAERRVASNLLTIWDGFTVAIERRLADGRYEYDFVTARIVDAVGEPINQVDVIDDPFASEPAQDGDPVGELDHEELPRVEVVALAKAGAGEEEEAERNKEHESADLAELPLQGELVTIPVSDTSSEFYTNVYQVMPTFLQMGVLSEKVSDPFAGPQDLKPSLPQPTAQEILERAGITFGAGTSAIFRSLESQLIVRNTLDQMELVEAYLESIKQKPENQVQVRAHFVEVAEPLFDDSTVLDAGADARQTTGEQALAMKVDSRADMAAILVENDVAAVLSARAPVIQPQVTSVVLTDSQWQTTLTKGRKLESWEESEIAAMFRSGQGGTVMAAGDRGLGVVEVVIGADGFTVELELMVQKNPEKNIAERNIGNATVTVWDGQTLAFESRGKDGSYRYDFVSVKILDPAGLALHAKANPVLQLTEPIENVRIVPGADR